MSSIQKISDTSWRIRYRDRGKQKSVTFITESKAKKWKAVLDSSGVETALAILEKPELNKLPLEEFLYTHIENLTGVTGGTKSGYRSHVSNNMAELLAVPVALLNRSHVSAWVNRLSSEGLSGKTIANMHGFLSSAMNAACAEKLAAENPCRGMRLPRTDHTDTEMVFLSREEFAHLYSLIPSHFQPFVLTLVGTGIRFGEATALMAGDVDLETRSVRIRQAWKKAKAGERDLGAPKTKRSNRTVALPPQVVQALAPLLESKSAKDFVFTSKTNTPILNATFWRNVWLPAVQEFAGDEVRIDHDKGHRKLRRVVNHGPGKHPRIHDLRHTFVSWAISSGIPLPVIQRQLGHESITTTIDRYGHLARADFDALATNTGKFLPTLNQLEG
jgi:integrase